MNSLSFGNFFEQEITQDKFNDLRQKRPKRIRFIDNSILNEDVDPTKRYLAFINVPFTESIFPILQKEIPSLGFFNNSFNFGYGIEDHETLDTIKKFITINERKIFIRSLLHSTVALDMNFESEQETYTEIGQHEHNAKENQNYNSLKYIIGKTNKSISKLPLYNTANCILAVPPSTGKKFSFTQEISKGVSKECNLTRLDEYIYFTNKKYSLQNENVKDKWSKLENSGLVISDELIKIAKNQTIILIDDLYQSGTTMHFLAMKLQEAGLNGMLGLAIVKARRDDDNSARE